jgi:hypothetical protein
MQVRQILAVLWLISLLACGAENEPSQKALTKVGPEAEISPGAPAPRPVDRPESIHWGQEDAYRLQLGAWLDSREPILRCVIRNQGDRTILYSDYLLGYWQSVTLKARAAPGNEWRVIPRKERVLRAYKSAGACSTDGQLLHPGQEMRPGFRQLVVPLQDSPYSFSVDLLDFDWPGSWTGIVETVVSQKLGDDGSSNTWTGTLESASIAVPTARLAPEVRE